MRDITIVPQDHIVIYTKTDTIMKKFDDGCEVYEVTEDRKPLVRCKDCKYLRIDSDFMKGRYCAIRNVNGGGFCKDEDYCSYGKRREDGEE